MLLLFSGSICKGVQQIENPLYGTSLYTDGNQVCKFYLVDFVSIC
jgi:hypothetical protein